MIDIFYHLAETIVVLVLVLIACGSLFVRVAFRAHRVRQDHDFEPPVTVMMACFNEGEAVFHTINSILNSDYPKDKLKVIVVDDCSRDDSWEWIQKAASLDDRVLPLRNETNKGKSKSLLRALSHADTELVLNVDSDGALHHRAIHELATCFVDPEVGGVGGNVMVRNANVNSLTEMQALQYNTAFQMSKVGETFSGSVNCISGAIFMTRKAIYEKIAPDIENRSWLGMEVKEGEDRFMTNLIINLGYKTVVNNRAKVFTDVPTTFSQFFSQQLRWRRGFFRTFLWQMDSQIVRKKLEVTTPFSVARLYLMSLLAMLIPGMVLWVLLTNGILTLVLLKLYLWIFIGTLYGIGYVIAKCIGNDITLGPFAFIVLPLWTIVDLTIVTALAAGTLGSSSWETRAKS